jgi:hypothetical protein
MCENVCTGINRDKLGAAKNPTTPAIIRASRPLLMYLEAALISEDSSSKTMSGAS